MIKKIILFTLLSFFVNNVEAKNLDKGFDSVIKESGISKSSISISVKDVTKEKSIYALNDQILMHPASVQKLITIIPVIHALGENYELSTDIYLRGNHDYIIKLGADPYLTTSDLKTLVASINRNSVKKIYIDDSIIEKKDWGEGWQWDDDLNKSMPRFNSYNLDGNIYAITVLPTELNKQAAIINLNKAPIVVLNNVITGKENNIKVTRDNVIASNVLKLEGSVKSPEKIYVPDNNLKRYFELKLTNELEDRNIYLKEPYRNTLISDSDIYISSVKHPISMAVEDILLNSNNMAMETISKIAGGKNDKTIGTDISAVNLCMDFYTKQNLDISRIRMVDASGVSKNNLVTADFVTEFLIRNQNDKITEKMATPGKGTLSNRMLPLQTNLKAKTGTLSDISSIAGYLTSKSGHKYVFCIIINDPSTKDSAKKNLENLLIRNIYLNL